MTDTTKTDTTKTDTTNSEAVARALRVAARLCDAKTSR
jgi:hypothetical protein